MENAVTGYWLYRQTKEPWILDVIQSIKENSSDWTPIMRNFHGFCSLCRKENSTELGTGWSDRPCGE